MDIKLKNIKVNLTFSEETTMFLAHLWINGKKVGYAENQGHGGNTNYSQWDMKDRGLIIECEEYCKNLPKVKYGEHEFDNSLESVIDELLEQHLKEKDMKKGLLLKDGEGGSQLLSWKGANLKKMLSTPQGTKQVRDQIVKLRGEGRVILNTNLPKEILI